MSNIKVGCVIDMTKTNATTSPQICQKLRKTMFKNIKRILTFGYMYLETHQLCL